MWRWEGREMGGGVAGSASHGNSEEAKRAVSLRFDDA
jgi:hypothetical protein